MNFGKVLAAWNSGKTQEITRSIALPTLEGFFNFNIHLLILTNQELKTRAYK